MVTDNKVNLSDGDKIAAGKLINEFKKEHIQQVKPPSEPLELPFGILGAISLVIIVVAIIVTFS